jgi:hypothetical protein
MIRLFARVRLGEQVFLGVRFSPRDLARLALSAVVIVPILPALTADHAQARGGWHPHAGVYGNREITLRCVCLLIGVNG